jgi:hypothetical protein
MKLINTVTGEELGHITTNHRMTIEEAADLLNVKIMQTQEDYESENGYDIEELDLVND